MNCTGRHTPRRSPLARSPVRTVRDTGIEPVLERWQRSVVPSDSSHVASLSWQSGPGIRASRVSFTSSQDVWRVTDGIRTRELQGHNLMQHANAAAVTEPTPGIEPGPPHYECGVLTFCTLLA